MRIKKKKIPTTSELSLGICENLNQFLGFSKYIIFTTRYRFICCKRSNDTDITVRFGPELHTLASIAATSST